MSGVPFVIGHRGAAELSPENTLEGIRRARSEGATWVEFDVKLCKDSEPVLFHDDTLHRTTSGEGAVAETTLDELSKLDAGGWFSEDCKGITVPTLKRTFETLAEEGLGANIEIKPAAGFSEETAMLTCEMVRDCWPKNLPDPIISSFDLIALEVARDRLPDVERAVLYYALPQNWQKKISELNCHAVHLLDSATTQEIVNSVNAVGYPVRVFTVNDPKRAEKLRSWGVQSVITDRPDLIKDEPSA